MAKTQKANLITEDIVKHVAKLANLPIPEKKLPLFQKQLESILEYVQLVQSTDTQGVPETTQTTGLTNVWRDDIVDDSRTLTQEQALKNAKKSYKGYFVVPSVFGSE